MKKVINLLLYFIVLIILISCTEYYTTSRKQTNVEWTRPKFNMTKEEIDQYFRNNDGLDPIEGLWKESLLFRIAGKSSIDNQNVSKSKAFKEISIDAIIKIDRYKYVLVCYELLDINEDYKFGEIIGYIQASIRDNEYILTQIIPPINGKTVSLQVEIVLQNNELYGIHEVESSGQYTSIVAVTEYIFKRIDDKSINDIESEKKGSGFFIDSNLGLVVTNSHIVSDCNNIVIQILNYKNPLNATIVLDDKNNDLCILQIENFDNSIFKNPIPYKIINSSNTRLGEKVYTLGFPLSAVLGNNIKYSTGNISSLFGLQEDPRVFQISNPIQPGNSGSPLFNDEGNIIGVVFSSLNAKYFFDHVDIITQNVNFAIKSNYLLNLISLLQNKDKIINQNYLSSKLSEEEQIKLAESFVVSILAY